MATHSERRYKTSEVIQPGESHETIPGLHHDIVVMHDVLSCANMGPVDIARLRSVSRAMYDAVEATGRVRELKEIQDLYQKLADITYVHATTPRDMHRRYQDLTAIVRKFGKPDLMLALTCNLQWPQITAALLESDKPADRPDILANMFQLKLDALVKEVEVDRTFGEMVACWVEVVSQKDWSRPQANILIFLKKKITTEVRVDDFMCAEVPTGNPQLREIVPP